MGWDRRLDFETALSVLLREYRRARTPKRKCYVIVYLTQLRNGSRISEAVRFLEVARREKRLEAYVQVSKSRARKERLMVFPKEWVSFEEFLENCSSVDFSVSVLKSYIKSIRRDWNTHSLRYAFINYLLRSGVNPVYVSKIIQHSRLDTLLHYTQVHVSEKILKDLI